MCVYVYVLIYVITKTDRATLAENRADLDIRGHTRPLYM